MSFCVVSRDLDRYQGRIDEQEARDEALTELGQEVLFDAIDNLKIEPALKTIVTNILAGDPDVMGYLVALHDKRCADNAGDY